MSSLLYAHQKRHDSNVRDAVLGPCLAPLGAVGPIGAGGALPPGVLGFSILSGVVGPGVSPGVVGVLRVEPAIGEHDPADLGRPPELRADVAHLDPDVHRGAGFGGFRAGDV